MITILLGMVLLACGLLSGCQAANGDVPAASGGRASGTPSSGQVALAVPVELRLVLGTSPCTQTPSTTTTSAIATTPSAPATMHDVDGVDCYQVSAPLMELQQLNTIGVASQPPASQWVITMTMTSPDAQTFAALTTQHDQQQLAFVVRGTVLSTQTVAQPITNGIVQLQGNFTQDDANRLVHQITS
jgi:preprotein translocase subunit SecD